MTIDKAWGLEIDSWVLAQRAAGSPKTTIMTRSQHLHHAAKRLQYAPWQMPADALVNYVGMQDWAPETRRGRRSTFRGFWGWGVTTGRTDSNIALALPVVKPAQPRPRPAPDAAYLQALMKAGSRERLMLRLAAEIGLRRAEVAVGHSRDIYEDLGGHSLTVHGKGDKERSVPLPPGLAAELRALPRGYFFPGADNGHLSPRWVGKLVTLLLPEELTMHTLRHRFATRAYAVDKDVFIVQELLGHASPATTRRYVQVPREGLRRTVLAAA